MAESTLEVLIAEKDRLVDSLSSMEVWVILFGIAVFIGVGGETFIGIRAWFANKGLHRIEGEIDQLRQAEIARLNKETSEANKRAADLQSKIMPRDLTEEQQKALGAACARFSRRSVRITADSSDPESWLLAELIQEALKKHGGIDESNRHPGV
jgi:hypothetical protein